MMAVAEAYETSWSLDAAFGDDRAPEERVFEPRPSAARAAAIRWYARVIRLAPDSDNARYVHRRVIRLKVGIDTGPRRFYCWYA